MTKPEARKIMEYIKKAQARREYNDLGCVYARPSLAKQVAWNEALHFIARAKDELGASLVEFAISSHNTFAFTVTAILHADDGHDDYCILITPERKIVASISEVEYTMNK